MAFAMNSFRHVVFEKGSRKEVHLNSSFRLVSLPDNVRDTVQFGQRRTGQVPLRYVRVWKGFKYAVERLTTRYRLSEADIGRK